MDEPQGSTSHSVDYFLSRRFGWIHRALGMPVRPTPGDRGRVKDALREIVDAAGALEYSRIQLNRVMKIALAEYERSAKGFGANWPLWGGANTPAVYYAFCNAVAWTRGVKDRYEQQLGGAVEHDAALWTELQKMRSRTVAREFEEARVLARCALHFFTPPYAGVGAHLEGGTLIYPIPRIVDPDDFRANPLVSGRHAASLVDEFWAATEKFVDGLLDVFHPTPAEGAVLPDGTAA
jgi:hypothetical protein